MNKKQRERRKREQADGESKARSESEDRQARIKVLWEELLEKKETQDRVRELGNSALGKTLLELVPLQKDEIDYLTKDEREREEIRKSSEFASLISDAGLLPKPTSKQRHEWKRRRLLGVGLIEREFGGVSEPGSQTLLALTKRPPILSPTCLDEIFAGGSVKMLKLEKLFGMDRNRFPKRQPYDYRAVVKIMDALLSETPSPKTRGRPRQTWLSDPDDSDLRSRVLSGIKRRINSPSMPERKKVYYGGFPVLTIAAIPAIPEHIKAAFLAVVQKHLPDSAKK